MIAALKPWLSWLLWDANFEREAYLSQATDVADLERRIRNWQRQSRPSFG